jgi:hypothetical protein
MSMRSGFDSVVFFRTSEQKKKFIGARESPKVDFFSAMEKKNEQHF